MSRNRWIKRALAGVLAVTASGGCKQQLFMSPADYSDAIKVAIPRTLETEPKAPIVPGQVNKIGGLSTVVDFMKPPRYMKLSECIAIGLEQGNIGLQSPTNFGFKNEQISQFSNRAVVGTDAVRAFAIDPAVAGAEVERSLSRFDARWVTTMQWQKIDQPTAAQFLSFQNAQDAAQFNSTLAKPLPTGGVAGITFSTNYSKFQPQSTQQVALVNPNYISTLQFSVEQPLLRLFGVEVNQISNVIPLGTGSITLPGLTPTSGAGTEGILITRLRVDQNRANFDLQINYMLANIEAAYWNLYSAYYNLYAQEEGLRQAFEGFRFIRIRVELGTAPPQDLDQIQAQFYRFQRQVYQARGQVLESERQLRGLVGLRSDDTVRIVPIDEPNLAPYLPDFHEAANDAIAYRPELMLARQDLKFQQLNLLLQKNLRRPDLRSYATYNVAGLGTRIGGPTINTNFNGSTTPGNVFGAIAQDRFNSWTVGMRFDVPIGFRDANGVVREAELNMTRSYVQLRDTELKAIEYLAGQYRRVIESHAEIAPARAERESLQRYIYRIREVIRIGSWNQSFFLNYLTVQQQLATAIATEAQAIASYNIALATFEFAKGTIQMYNRVSVGDGPLPPWVQKRAADHFRERAEVAIKTHEQPAPSGPVTGGHPIAPAGGTNSLLNLPFGDEKNPLPELPPGEPKDGNKPNDGNKPKNPVNLDLTPQPLPAGVSRMLPIAPGAGQPQGSPRPMPNLDSGALGQPDGYFKPDGRVNLPPLPPGARRITSGAPAAPLTATPGQPDGYFKPDGRVVLPPPMGASQGTAGTTTPTFSAPTGGSPEAGDYFKADGRVTVPQPKPNGAVWVPPGQTGVTPPAPPASGPGNSPPVLPPTSTTSDSLPPAVGAVPPLPPIIPPTLPPVPTAPGGQ